MPEWRFRFEKRGRAAYLSHLDVMRTFQRAFLRSEIPLRHSEGFNPHPKMSIALPLQLGCESVCEVLDVSLLEEREDMPVLLNAALPEGLRILRAAPTGLPVKLIAWTEWELRFPSEEEARSAEKCLRIPSLPVEKKTKRGLSTLDIAPHIELLSREGKELRVRLRADAPTVNAGDLRKALSGALGRELPMSCLRLCFLTENLEAFQ